MHRNGVLGLVRRRKFRFRNFCTLCGQSDSQCKEGTISLERGTNNWYSLAYIMAKNTSIVLGEYFENFINEQIASGKYNSVSEVIRTALRAFEQEENKAKALVNELKIGEKSGQIRNFDRQKNLEKLHAKFQK